MTRQASRDAALRHAITAAGGIGTLARALGLSQPTVSLWKRVPPHHVIKVEALTGISRRILRPDLYDAPEPPCVAADPGAAMAPPLPLQPSLASRPIGTT